MPTAPAAAPAAGSARLAATGRGVLTLALVFGVGGAVFLALVDRGPAPAPMARGLAAWAARAVAPAAVLALGLHGLDLIGAPVGALLGPAPWAVALVSPFAVMAATSLLAGFTATSALRRDGAAGGALATTAWGLAAVSFALFGHAATAPPCWLTAPAVALHAGAFVFWIGALPGLAERAARPNRSLSPTLYRFSALAVPLVALLVASGAALAIAQVRHPSALFATAYGRLLLAKLAAVALLLLLAALNRLRFTPAIERGAPRAPTSFRRSVAAEIVLGVLVLALASGFRLTPPPRALAAAPADVYVHLHGPTVMADVTLTPGRVGANDVTIGIVSTTGASIDPLEVRIGFSDPARGVEPIRLNAVRDGEDWRAGPLQLPHGGEWTVTLDVLVSDFARATLEATAPVGGR
jgi:copper transport protein